MRTKIDDLKLKELWEQGLTDCEIAIELNASDITIGNHRRKLGLKSNKKKNTKKLEISRDELQDLCDSLCTDSAVARHLGIRTEKVKKLREKYSISIMNYGANPTIELTQIQKEFIFGCLLGDGYCKKVGDDKNATFEFQHSLKQKEYAEYKKSFLLNIPGRAYEYDRNDIRTNTIYHTYTVSFLTNKCFTDFHNLFYVEGKKRVPIEYLEELYTPLAIAIHYMDDGSCTKKSGYNSYDLSIATCSFSIDDLNQLVFFLKRKFDLDFTIQSSSNRIRLRSKDIPKFINLIKPYVPECMLYKIDVS